ncbi:MAG: NAD(P)H-hydrate dehydratase [Gammaproteobacteria bacterium]|nr:MAG: NAD(P)H-hydrate dehydratase [Gammaproteobacteria bacterium]
MSHHLPVPLYTAHQVRELDRIAIQDCGIPGIKLMKRAGYAVFQQLISRWPGAPVTVLCGAGNNGGDGYIVAALAAESCLSVEVIQLAPAEKLRGDALLAYNYALQAGVSIKRFSDGMGLTTGVVVDALLGTGLTGPVREPFAQAISLINDSGLPVVSVDIPSGLCSDTGTAAGPVVEADVTVTFIGLKQGLFTGAGPQHTGELLFDNLRVPEVVYHQIQPECERLVLDELLPLLPKRRRDAHKGDFGHVLVVGGELGFGGAVAMAAEAALRTGAGLVSVATRPEHVSALLSRCPELMVNAVSSGQALLPLLERASVVVVGPGLGKTPWSEQLLRQVLMMGKPTVVDADGLNLLAAQPSKTPDSQHWILTPHPGEAARLLGKTVTEVQSDRFSAVRELWKKYQCPVLLKGAGSLICHSNKLPVAVCSGGNPGMASGGMGDVLSGITGALLAQGIDPGQALSLAVGLHAEAADRAAVDGERGMVATDLLGPLRRLVNP